MSNDTVQAVLAALVGFKYRSRFANNSAIILRGEEFTVQITRDYPEKAGVHADRHSTQAVAARSATLGGNSWALAQSFVELSRRESTSS